jgi:hypothetical protein
MKLTSNLLRKVIMQEVSKMKGGRDVEDVEAEELDADEFGSDKSLEKKIDYMKALKIEESRLRKRIDRISEMRRRIARSL